MSLDKLKKENLKMGKKGFINKLVTNYSNGIKDMTVLDLIKDHLELYPKFQSKKLLNKVRKMNKKNAQKEFVKYYKNNLKKQSLKVLVEENT